MENNKNLKKYKTIMDILICISVIVLSIKKGGFYKQDSLIIALFISFIGIINVLYESFKLNKKDKIDLKSVLILLLPIFYFLPILFKNYTNLSDAIFESLRYVNLFIVYSIVKDSSNKELYKWCFIILATIQSILGFDGILSRHLDKLLGNFNTGYLDKDYTRLSGTIQYANTTAIIILIGIFFVLDKLSTILNKSNMKQNLSLKIVLNVLLFVNLVALILTESRTVLLIFFVGVFIKYIISKNKTLNLFRINFLFSTIYSVIFAGIFFSNLGNNNLLYILTFIAIIVNVILSYFIFKIDINLKKDSDKKIVNKKRLIPSIIVVLMLTLYIVLALKIDTTLKIESDNTNSYSLQRNVYKIDNGRNVINLKLKNDLDENNLYEIKVYEVLNDGTRNLIQSFTNYNTSTGNFLFEYNKNIDFKCLNFVFEKSLGSIEVEELKINDKKVILNYVLIPSDIIFRIEDVLHGSSSIKDRVEYVKDSIRLITLSYKNFIIGLGGEGFKNLYEKVQTVNYYSTEAHNSYMQIFVEAGVFAFVAIIFAIILTIKEQKDKNSYLFFTFLAFIIHSIFDLNFSYLLSILVFGILLGMLSDKENYKINVKGVLEFYTIIKTFVITIALIILIFATVANIKFERISDVAGTNLNENIENISKLEKVVKLDFSDIDYRKRLNKEYFSYLENLEENKNEELLSEDKKESIDKEIEYVIEQIKNNVDKIFEYDKYNKSSLKYVNSVYFKYLDYFADLYYPNNQEEGIEEYNQFIQKNIDYVKQNIRLDVKKKDVLKSMENLRKN